MDPDRRTLVKSTYDALAAPYAANLSDELAGKPLDRALLERFAEHARGRGRVLDLGTGPGHVARYLHDRGVDVAGVDLSEAMVAEARRRNPGVGFRAGDMLALDVADGALAGIVSFYAIVHLGPDALAAACHEMRRVLAPGGAALVAFHVGEGALRPGELWGVPVALDWRLFPTRQVVDALEAAGLRVLELTERAPYAGVEHASRRAYVFAGV